MTIFNPTPNPPITRANLELHANTGRAENITYLMETLETARSFAQCKIIDYALGLVVSAEGREAIKNYLFNGSPVQRNYAALYFKRLGNRTLINRAVQQGCIDEIQGYSK